MHFVTYSCPLCRAQKRAPVLEISNGEIGIWQCEACERAFRIHVEFRPISQDELEQSRERIAPSLESPWLEDDCNGTAEETRAKLIAARLVEVNREILRRRQEISELEQETMTLEEERQSL